MPRKIPYFKPSYTPSAEKTYERQRPRVEDIAFYHTARWKRLRAAKMAENPVCEKCRVALAEHVHHVKPRKSHPDLAHEWDNLEALCIPCHNAQAKR